MISFEPANQYGTMPGNPNALDDATPICVGRMHPYKLWIIWRKCPQCRRTVWHVSVLNSISSCYGSIPLAVGLIGRDGDLSTLCHSCRVVCQQMVLKTFPGPGYLPSEDGVVWLWHSLVNLYIYIYIYIYSIYIHKNLFVQLFQLRLAICENYKIKCFKLSNINNNQKKVYVNKIETVGHNDR